MSVLRKNARKNVRQNAKKNVGKNVRRHFRLHLRKNVRQNVRRYVRNNARQNVRRYTELMPERMSERLSKECQKIASNQSVKLKVTGMSGDELYVYPHLTRSGWHLAWCFWNAMVWITRSKVICFKFHVVKPPKKGDRTERCIPESGWPTLACEKSWASYPRNP